MGSDLCCDPRAMKVGTPIDPTVKPAMFDSLNETINILSEAEQNLNELYLALLGHDMWNAADVESFKKEISDARPSATIDAYVICKRVLRLNSFLYELNKALGR